jgi:hypothetical protein
MLNVKKVEEFNREVNKVALKFLNKNNPEEYNILRKLSVLKTNFPMEMYDFLGPFIKRYKHLTRENLSILSKDARNTNQVKLLVNDNVDRAKTVDKLIEILEERGAKRYDELKFCINKLIRLYDESKASKN